MSSFASLRSSVLGRALAGGAAIVLVGSALGVTAVTVGRVGLAGRAAAPFEAAPGAAGPTTAANPTNPSGPTSGIGTTAPTTPTLGSNPTIAGAPQRAGGTPATSAPVRVGPVAADEPITFAMTLKAQDGAI